MKNKVYNRNKTKRIHEPYVNGYCEKCIHNDGDVDDLGCNKIVISCDDVVECALYDEGKENVSKV